MARYITNSRNQGIMLSINLDDQLIPGTLEATIDAVVDEQLDLSAVDATFKNDWDGAPAYNPADLLKVVFCAYLRGFFSSRSIERLCRDSVVFIALSGDLRPDHATIARFVSRLAPHIEMLFGQVLLYCDSLDLLSGTTLAIDGCKIPSNAAKESSGTFAELKKKRARFQEIAQELMEKAQAAEDEEQRRLLLRAEKHRSRMERIGAFLDSHEERMGTRKKEIKSNITDNESGKLHSGHGVIQGYNAMAAVDDKHQIIVSSIAVGTIFEGHYLKNCVEQAKAFLPNRITKATMVLADTGYFSEENCAYLFDSGQAGIIPDQHFRQRDPRFHRDPETKNRNPRRKNKRLFDHEDFTYDRESNRYTCPAGKILRSEGRRNLGGHIGRRYSNQDGDCPVCHVRTQCLRKNAKNRHLFIVEKPKVMPNSQRMKDLIDSSEGREAYSKRMGIVEPVFANITATKRLNRFHYRGAKRVTVQWRLFCMVHNLEKIHRYG